MSFEQNIEKDNKQNKEAVLIVNTHSRKGRDLFFKAIDLLEDRGIVLTSTFPVHDPVRLPQIVQDSIERGAKFVIVGGGDGTISSVVDFFAYRDAVLGLLPLGTGNSFVRTLGIPVSLEGAVDVIAGGKVVNVDLGLAGDDYFANVSSIGLSTVVARKISRQLKRRFGRIAYGIAGATVLLSFEPFSCHFISKEKDITLKTRQIIIANGRFHGGAMVAPGANVNSRELVVFTMGGFSRWQLFKIWVAYQFGKHTALPESNYFTTNNLTVEIDPPQYVDVDGEVTTKTPVRFTVAEEALKVIAPLNFEELQ
jgi:YegS/Rv2252/BmrU family lipid kinase